MIFVGIDPSIRFTGYAALLVKTGCKPDLLMTDVLKPINSQDYDRITVLSAYLEGYLKSLMEHRENILVTIEMPHYQESYRKITVPRYDDDHTMYSSGDWVKYKDHHAVLTDKEDHRRNIHKLILTAGAYIGVAAACDVEMQLVPVKTWKRNMKKEEVRARVEQYFPERCGDWETSDEWEAVGIALWAWRHHANGTTQ